MMCSIIYILHASLARLNLGVPGTHDTVFPPKPTNCNERKLRSTAKGDLRQQVGREVTAEHCSEKRRYKSENIFQGYIWGQSQGYVQCMHLCAQVSVALFGDFHFLLFSSSFFLLFSFFPGFFQRFLASLRNQKLHPYLKTICPVRQMVYRYGNYIDLTNRPKNIDYVKISLLFFLFVRLIYLTSRTFFYVTIL